jgi:hypothetical protein
MLKRNVSGLLLSTVLLAGCATTGTRNNQTDIDARNARLAALEGQLTAKDQELNALKDQVGAEGAARDAAEAERMRLAAQLESARAESRKPQAPASDLK